MFGHLEVYHDTEPRSAALNMAVDEALLNATTSPAIRFYRWERPSISFGYFGLFAEVADQQPQRDLIRRWTGGGIVPHGEDLTYSVFIPRGDLIFARSSREIYSQLHDAIRRTLKTHGVNALLANDGAPKISEQCFANPVHADLLSNGKKIAGAAHRRSRVGLLHQGSIQISGLPDSFCDELAAILCDRFVRKSLAPELIARANELVQVKYGTTDWLMRR